MNRSGLHLLAALLVVAIPWAEARAQDPNELQRQIIELKKKLDDQRTDFDAKLTEMNERLTAASRPSITDQELTSKIDEAVASGLKLYLRPQPGGSATQNVFSALQGGLIFSGLFRTRFEARQDNVDFNSRPNGLDDSGIRFNGRFRLGFGAALLENTGGNGPQITALTEFQAYGTFANNSFVNTPSNSNGIPDPFAFNILTEPFESVGLYQGYLYFQRLIAPSINVKVGRQEIVFGNEMILGNNTFYDGTVHDSLLVNWDRTADLEFRLSGLYSKEAASDNRLITRQPDFDEDEMAAVYFEYRNPKKWLQLDAYGVFFNARSSSNDIFVTGSTAFFFDGSYTPPILGHTWTLGSRAFVSDIGIGDGVLSLNAEGAFQFGRDESTAVTNGRRSIHGWQAEFIANWHIDPGGEGLNPIATLAYYYAGGGDGLKNGSIGFQPLYINRHFEIQSVGDRNDPYKPYYPGGGRYGNMDEIPLNNIHIMKGSLSAMLSSNIEIGGTYLYSVTATDIGYGSGTFGQEIDIFGNYYYSDNVQFGANASVFFPGRTAHDFSQLLFFDPLGTSSSSNEVALAFYLQALIQF